MSSETPAGRRDRRGRGMRGPAYLSGRLAPDSVPARRSGAERFDSVAVAVMRDVEGRWPEELATLELAVEEVPLLPEHWSTDTIPLASYVEANGVQHPRLVLFRRPIEHRADSRADLEALILTVIVEQVADVLGIPPEKVHPGYQPG